MRYRVYHNGMFNKEYKQLVSCTRYLTSLGFTWDSTISLVEDGIEINGWYVAIGSDDQHISERAADAIAHLIVSDAAARDQEVSENDRL